MRKSISIRVEVGLLEKAKRQAVLENRTLTNLIETALRERCASEPQAQVKTAKRRKT